MLTTYDITEVRRFAQALEAERAACGGDSTFCSDLDQAIGCLTAVCEKWRLAVSDWADAVFTGRVKFNYAVEDLFKAELRRVLNDARPLVEYGHEVEAECFSLERLDALTQWAEAIDFLLKNWVSPQRSVAPAPRVSLTDAATQEMAAKLQSTPPLPEGWEPTDRRQLRIFRRRPTS